MTTQLTEYLTSLANRCPNCGSEPVTQGHTPTCVSARKDAALASVTSTDEKRATVDAAIRRFSRLHIPFTANDMRAELAGISGPLVGARFNALAKAGVIEQTGRRIPSNLASTNGHPIIEWRGVR